jgi:caffeoyl-CoA O-methyltransferase
MEKLLAEIKTAAMNFSIPIMRDDSLTLLKACVKKAVEKKLFEEYSKNVEKSEYSKKGMRFRILEIGSGIGYSGISMLSAADESLNAFKQRAVADERPPDNSDCIFPVYADLTTLELDSKSAETARRFFEKSGTAKNVRLIEGDAAEFIVMTGDKFDFILLDGPKGQYERFRPYLKNMLNDGGVIFADNMSFKGYVNDAYIRHKHRSIVNALNAYLKNMKDDPDFETLSYDVGDGITVSIKDRHLA